MALTNCPNCGHVVSTTATKCPGCGMAVNQEPPSQTVFCVYCGEKMDSSFSFCPKCGKNVKKNTSKDNVSKGNIKTDSRETEWILAPLLAPPFSIGILFVLAAMPEIVRIMLNWSFVFSVLLTMCLFGLGASFYYAGKRTSLKVIAIIVNLIMVIIYSVGIYKNFPS